MGGIKGSVCALILHNLGHVIIIILIILYTSNTFRACASVLFTYVATAT